MTTATDILLQPFELSSSVSLANRIAMAPMTRSMAGPGNLPTEEMAAYYGRRAGAGLLISEGAIIRSDGQGYPDVPGIFNDAQIEAWSRVTGRVHDEGGKFFLQLWHVGRISHPTFLGGELPVAPSAVAPEGRVPRGGGLEYGTPRALETGEVQDLVEAYGAAAAAAMEAGCDGVEIHGANGYVIDQFLHHHTNLRDDDYGGSPEKMARFAIDVVDAVIQSAGAERVGIRLSPGAYHYMESDPLDPEVFKFLLGSLAGRDLAYVHVGIFDHSSHFEDLGGTAEAFLRRHYSGTLIGCGSYDPETAAKAIENDDFDLIAFGRPFIANPDFIERIRSGGELRPYEPEMLLRLE